MNLSHYANVSERVRLLSSWMCRRAVWWIFKQFFGETSGAIKVAAVRAANTVFAVLIISILIPLTTTSGSSKWSLSSGYLTRLLYAFIVCVLRILLRCMPLIIFYEDYKLRKLSLYIVVFLRLVLNCLQLICSINLT
jgi:hypothetical protein